MQARGRGADGNPPNRFEKLHVETDADAWVDDDPRPLRTIFLRDDSQSVLATNDADDLSFEYGLNPYRGCEHGCAYCYARTYHEYLGFSAGLDFESKIVVKPDAPELLEKTLAKASYKPGSISLSGVTDCYQPVERKLELTRRCLEVLARFRNPVVVITKNALVARDLDHLAELARHDAVAVYLSITTLDSDLARVLEPRASSPRARLETIHKLADAGAICRSERRTDDSRPQRLRTARHSGRGGGSWSHLRRLFAGAPARRGGGGFLLMARPPPAAGQGENSRPHPRLTWRQTQQQHPVARIRGTGEAAGQWQTLFHACCRKHGLHPRTPELSLDAFCRLSPGQGELF